MSHPILQCLYIADMVLQIPGRKRVPEFVEEEFGAVWPFRAFVSVF